MLIGQLDILKQKKFKVSQNKKDERIEAEAEVIEENESKKDIFGEALPLMKLSKELRKFGERVTLQDLL